MVTRRSREVFEFRFLRPNARGVCLVGDFNGWHPSSLPMQKSSDAWWSLQLRLEPGVYQFQYSADGERHLDFAAFGLERGPLGGWNSVVVVDGPRISGRVPWVTEPAMSST